MITSGGEMPRSRGERRDLRGGARRPTVTNAAGGAEAAATNNHATWYHDQVTSYAEYAGDRALAATGGPQRHRRAQRDHRSPGARGRVTLSSRYPAADVLVPGSG
jgi:hypothetical protein